MKIKFLFAALFLTLATVFAQARHIDLCVHNHSGAKIRIEFEEPWHGEVSELNIPPHTRHFTLDNVGCNNSNEKALSGFTIHATKGALTGEIEKISLQSILPGANSQDSYTMGNIYLTSTDGSRGVMFYRISTPATGIFFTPKVMSVFGYNAEYVLEFYDNLNECLHTGAEL